MFYIYSALRVREFVEFTAHIPVVFIQVICAVSKRLEKGGQVV